MFPFWEGPTDRIHSLGSRVVHICLASFPKPWLQTTKPQRIGQFRSVWAFSVLDTFVYHFLLGLVHSQKIPITKHRGHKEMWATTEKAALALKTVLSESCLSQQDSLCSGTFTKKIYKGRQKTHLDFSHKVKQICQMFCLII